jgi:hypothetical protein
VLMASQMWRPQSPVLRLGTRGGCIQVGRVRVHVCVCVSCSDDFVLGSGIALTPVSSSLEMWLSGVTCSGSGMCFSVSHEVWWWVGGLTGPVCVVGAEMLLTDCDHSTWGATGTFPFIISCSLLGVFYHQVDVRACQIVPATRSPQWLAVHPPPFG